MVYMDTKADSPYKLPFHHPISNMTKGRMSRVDRTEFSECWKIAWERPYIMRLALSAGLGGLLFGYDTGVISGALLYIRDDFPIVDKNTWMQETIVSMAVAGAIFGAAVGGWVSDTFGRRKSILVADCLFFLGAIVMGTAECPWMIIFGRVIVGLGVGMASMSVPLYISEASPHRIRGALVSINQFFITGGIFLSYLSNLAFVHVHGTWRWMLGIAAIPALFQFVLMTNLPESPRWLFRKGKEVQAEDILERIFPAEEVTYELNALLKSLEQEQKVEGNLFCQLKSAWKNDAARRGLYAGVTVLVAQQFVGINTVMYYSPTIIQFAGFASNKNAIALSLIISGLNVIGSILSLCFVDKYGRRRLMIISMIGIIFSLAMLAFVFYYASITTPSIGLEETTYFGVNSTCSVYREAIDASSWGCMRCLGTDPQCGFCAIGSNMQNKGACLATTTTARDACFESKGTWYTQGCPSDVGFLAIIFLGLYIISFSPGMGPVPWIVNSEIYPLKYRGLGGGIAAVANWSSNLIVSETFLTLTDHLGSYGSFLLYSGFSLVGLVFIYFLVPETKGLQFDEVEMLLETRYNPFATSKENVDVIDNR